MSNYIQYDSPEWRAISHCLLEIDFYGNYKCHGKNNRAYLSSGGMTTQVPCLYPSEDSDEDIEDLANEAIALLREKHPEYNWRRGGASLLYGEKQ